MPTSEEVSQFFDQMKCDMAETRRMIETEERLMKAIDDYEKAWGVKIRGKKIMFAPNENSV